MRRRQKKKGAGVLGVVEGAGGRGRCFLGKFSSMEIDLGELFWERSSFFG